MISLAPPGGVRYTARITGVREVALYGTADLDFWRGHLRPLGLLPATVAGGAHVMLSASALSWMGLRFRELVVSVATCSGPDRAQADSFYMAQAFNSSPALAWAERRMFKSPYDHCGVRLDLAAPLIELRQGGSPLLRAQMRPPAAAPARADQAWQGPVFLPAAGGERGHYSFVAISGEQDVYPFSPASDAFEIAPAAAGPIFQWLSDSRFTPGEWRVRASATHARSQTFRRDVAGRA